ncbi:hypothetical protein BASA50_001696 [Batrachochytrium salamandrivorans]|uniref:TLC domain-containing protein n=1 Tax=Batrachochytrium salamandrivorans TaxID=1357716 RepID=A0ABQ8FPQ9_9FUNG|nr:hypothetical protein BASA50_001696 [Batrachochytrium salamandrivorans]
MAATPSLDWTVLLQPTAYAAFSCALVVQAILFFGTRRLWPWAFTTSAQTSWILTTTSSVFMTLASLPFLFDYLTHGSDLSRMPLLNSPSAVVCSMFFISYLGCDLIFGYIYYRDQIDLITGWLHHLIYPFVIVSAVVLQFPGAFLVAAFMELPTIVLALGHMKKSFRSEYLFGMSFFVTRIVFHLYFAWRAYAVWYQYPFVMILALGTFPLHIHWFGRWVKRQIRIFRKSRQLSQRLSQANAIVDEDLNEYEIEITSSAGSSTCHLSDFHPHDQQAAVDRSMLLADRQNVAPTDSYGPRFPWPQGELPVETTGYDATNEEAPLPPHHVISEVRIDPSSQHQPWPDARETDDLLGRHLRSPPRDRASVIVVPEYRNSILSAHSLGVSYGRHRSNSNLTDNGLAGTSLGGTVRHSRFLHDGVLSALIGNTNNNRNGVRHAHSYSDSFGWHRPWISFPVVEPTRDGVDPAGVSDDDVLDVDLVVHDETFGAVGVAGVAVATVDEGVDVATEVDGIQATN